MKISKAPNLIPKINSVQSMQCRSQQTRYGNIKENHTKTDEAIRSDYIWFDGYFIATSFEKHIVSSRGT